MLGKLWQIAYAVAVGFFTNRLSTSAAAMAFYTMFALGPIMIFSIAIAEPFVGKLMAQQAIFDALGSIVEAEHLKSIQRFASQDLFRGGGLAAIVGAVVLLYTGSRVFVELDDSIEVIWRGTSTRQVHLVVATIKSRGLALLLMDTRSLWRLQALYLMFPRLSAIHPTTLLMTLHRSVTLQLLHFL